MVKRTIGVHQNLPTLTANLFKLGRKPLEIARRQRKQKPIARPV